MASLRYISLIIWILQIIPITYGLGVFVKPALKGDKSKHSSLNYMINCVSYETVKDDIIIVRIKSGDRIGSQILNLHIFDSDNNMIRTSNDIANDLDLIFTNLNNPNQIKENGDVLHQIKRSSFFKKMHGHSKEELFIEKGGKSVINICFDNLYSDKSWSFKPREREVEVFVDIKDMTKIKETNYQTYAKYFNAKKYDRNSDRSSFTEADFDVSISELKNDLQTVIDSLDKSQLTLDSLLDYEVQLRDANEEIFHTYSLNTIVIFVIIGIFGAIQIFFTRRFLKKKGVL